MRQKLSKGQLEARLGEAISKFEKEYLGRGPAETKAYIVDDMVLVRLKGVLTPAEVHLAKSPDGADLIKRTRLKLVDGAREILEKIVFELTGSRVVTLHTDISTRKGERIFVFCLSDDIGAGI
jgi:uncharacterized protein YbcI